MRPSPAWLLIFVALVVSAFSPTHGADPSSKRDPFAPENILAWCIVPFDAKQRGPEERAAMLEKLGIRRFAYDYRKEHIATWDAELEALKRHGIELTAWWFPSALNDEAKATLALFKKHAVKPDLWVSGGGAPTNSSEEQAQRVQSEAARLRPIAEAAQQQGLRVALYNHGGWFGEPENQLAVLQALQMANVGLVYNFHHGHEHVARFAELWPKMKAQVFAVNLNGMIAPGLPGHKKILPLGTGKDELALMQIIRDSGWFGQVGILNHRPEMDAEVALRENLDGLKELRAALRK